jgi:hypothetical protein
MVGEARGQAVGEGSGVGVAWIAIMVASIAAESAAGLFSSVRTGVIFGGLFFERQPAKKTTRLQSNSTNLTFETCNEHCLYLPIRLILSRGKKQKILSGQPITAEREKLPKC